MKVTGKVPLVPLVPLIVLVALGAGCKRPTAASAVKTASVDGATSCAASAEDGGLGGILQGVQAPAVALEDKVGQAEAREVPPPPEVPTDDKTKAAGVVASAGDDEEARELSLTQSGKYEIAFANDDNKERWTRYTSWVKKQEPQLEGQKVSFTYYYCFGTGDGTSLRTKSKLYWDYCTYSLYWGWYYTVNSTPVPAWEKWMNAELAFAKGLDQQGLKDLCNRHDQVTDPKPAPPPAEALPTKYVVDFGDAFDDDSRLSDASKDLRRLRRVTLVGAKCCQDGNETLCKGFANYLASKQAAPDFVAKVAQQKGTIASIESYLGLASSILSVAQLGVDKGQRLGIVLDKVSGAVSKAGNIATTSEAVATLASDLQSEDNDPGLAGIKFVLSIGAQYSPKGMSDIFDVYVKMVDVAMGGLKKIKRGAEDQNLNALKASCRVDDSAATFTNQIGGDRWAEGWAAKGPF